MADQREVQVVQQQQQQNVPTPIDQLSIGLLKEFTSLTDLEEQLRQIVNNQQSLLQNMAGLNEFYAQNEDLQEVQLMVSLGLAL
jgi:hypothetical protein